VSGVPPDAFSATGQLWGSPLYKWPAHEAEDYAWWCQRIGRAGQVSFLVYPFLLVLTPLSISRFPLLPYVSSRFFILDPPFLDLFIPIISDNTSIQITLSVTHVPIQSYSLYFWMVFTR
jgi:hypothetical protein